MNEELSTRQGERTAETVAAEIRMIWETGRRVTMLCGIEIGRRLCEAKELVGHGEWLNWLAQETPFSDRHAQNYMRIFREYGADQLGLFGPETNAKYISDLPISKALLLLSVPESDREEFAESVDAESLSEKELKEEIRKLKKANEVLAKDRDELDELRERAEKAAVQWEETAGGYASQVNDLQADLLEAQKQMKALEARPVEVAVERDEEAIREAASAARAEADEAWKKRLEAAQKDLEKAEQEKDKLLRAAQKEKEKAEKAGEETAEKLREAELTAAAARNELEQARKQLAASNKDIAEFGFHFKAVQRELAALRDSLEAVKLQDPETGAKLAGALKTILAPWVGIQT